MAVQTTLCSHDTWFAKEVILADGRRSLREFCFSCGASSDGSRLGAALPMISDVDLTIPSFKYHGKTLGEIAIIDSGYLEWIVKESKTSSRVKKSAARILSGNPYTSPKPGDRYEASKCYMLSRDSP